MIVLRSKHRSLHLIPNQMLAAVLRDLERTRDKFDGR
jgi:hypothetical protein